MSAIFLISSLTICFQREREAQISEKRALTRRRVASRTKSWCFLIRSEGAKCRLVKAPMGSSSSSTRVWRYAQT